MVVTTADDKKKPKKSADKPNKKPRPRRGGGKKKLTPFNKFMRDHMARLKVDYPDMTHQEKFKEVVSRWNAQKEAQT